MESTQDNTQSTRSRPDTSAAPTAVLYASPGRHSMISHSGAVLTAGNSSGSSSSPKSTAAANNSTNAAAKPLTPAAALLDAAAADNPPSYKSSTDGTVPSSSPPSALTNSSRRFSFNKRPIFKNGKLQRKSSQISIIHNYPPQRCDSVNHDTDHSKFYLKYKGIMKDKDELPDNAINDLSFEYNYDDKIRAPRMSAASLISSRDTNHTLPTHVQQQQQQRHLTNKMARQTSAPALLKRSSNTSSNHTLDSLAEETSNAKEALPSYKPAAYDLTKQLRRFSISNDDLKSNEPSTAATATTTATASGNIFNDSTGNYTYKIQPRKKSVVSNSSSNISPTKEKTIKLDDDLKPVKQIDEPMKLLDNYVPPVLRPTQNSSMHLPRVASRSDTKNSSIADSQSSTASNASSAAAKKLKDSSISTTPPSAGGSTTAAAALLLSKNNGAASQKGTSLGKIHNQLLSQLIPSTSNVSITTSNSNLETSLHSLSSDPTPPTSSNSSSEPNVVVKNNSKSIEPSHSHWRPNSSTNSCENCLDNFNVIKRKHHCRHCGKIFCSKCLQHYSNLNLLAHFERPDDCPIPSIHNHLISSLAPIKSTETTGTCTTVNSNNTINSSTTNNTHNTSQSNFKNSGYSKFCKVCPSCYTQWLKFLASDEDYEGKNSHINEMTNSNLDSQETRKESITGVPTDWNWSSF